MPFSNRRASQSAILIICFEQKYRTSYNRVTQTYVLVFLNRQHFPRKLLLWGTIMWLVYDFFQNVDEECIKKNLCIKQLWKTTIFEYKFTQNHHKIKLNKILFCGGDPTKFFGVWIQYSSTIINFGLLTIWRSKSVYLT